MADTNRKKTDSFDQGTLIDNDKEEQVEKAAQSKKGVKSSKPPLPPRPPGLGKVSPAKRGTNPSKSVPRKVHPKDNLNEGSSVPRRPPPPSHQTGIQNAGNEGQENKERQEECTQNDKAELSSPEITFPRVHDSTSQGNCEHDKHIESHPDDSQTEANSVSKLSQESIEVDPSVNSNKKQGGDDEVIKLSPPENHTEPKNPAAQPSRLESLNTCTESSPSHLHSPSAAAKCETLENSVNAKTSSASHKTNSKMPERPRPPDRLPSIATEDKSNSLDSAKNSPALSETPPHVSKTPKKTPPVPPKPYSSKNSVGKQGPLIQVRTDKQPTRGKTTQETEASEIVKKSDVEKSGTLDVERPSREESRTENASLEVIVVPQTNEEVSSTPENNDVFDEEIKPSEPSNENNLPSVVSIPTEEHSKVGAAIRKEAADNVISPTTEKGSVGSEAPKREAKPRRPRAPSRKIKEITEMKISDDNLTIPDNNSSIKPDLVDERSSNVETKAADNVISPKTEKGSFESENVPKKEAKPPRPCAPSRKTEEMTEVKISNDNLTTSDNTSVKPELEDEKSSNVETKATDNVISPKTEKGSVESENEPKREAKPPRPRPPSRKTEEITEMKISDDNSTDNTSVKPELIDEKSSNVETKDILHESKKIENITSPKPPRPLAPVRKTAGEKTLESHDSSLSTSSEPSYPLEQHSTDAVTEHDKTEKVASPKPSRPSRPIHTPHVPKTVKGLGNQEEAKDGGSVKHKNKEKPQRPSQPQLPSERLGASIDSSSFHHESPKVKPQRPSKPNFPDEATQAKEPGSSSKNENTAAVNNETPQTEASTKNAEIVIAEETRQDDTKQEKSLSEQQEILKDKQEHKHIVSNRPSRPAKPNVETTVVQKERKEVKEDTIESESNQSGKKTGPAKPSRPPKPSDAQNVSSSEMPSSDKTEATRPRPPRPQAPPREKQLSVINVVETSAKAHERDHEKNRQTGVQTKRSVEAPPKPKRISISSDDRSDVQLSHQEDTNQPVEILKENKEILNEAMSDESEKAVSDRHDSASTENCDETNKNLGEEQCEAGEHSKPFVEPPLPNKTNHVSTQNAPFIIVKRRDKGVQETSDDQQSPDRHNVKFRVSSLTKTEVESFNSKDFVEKLNDKGGTKRNSAEAPAVTPPIGPKPSRPRPPSGDKHTGSGGKHEGQAEGHGNEVFEMRNEDKGEVIKNNETSELEHVTNAEADDASCAADKVSKNDKEAPIGEIKVNECPHNDVVSSEKTDKKKVKRKAPPVPDEKQSEHVKKHSEHVKEHNELVEKHSENVEKHSEHVEKHNEHVKKHSENVEKQSEHIEERSENVEKRSEHVEIHSEHVDDALSSKKIENNNEPAEEITHDAVDVTVKHQVTVNENAEGNVPEPVEDANQACSVSESLSSCRNTSDVLTPETEVKTQKVDQDVSHEVTPSLCNEPSKQDSQQDENAGMTQGTDFVQPRKKKKTPPPKPVRTSSLKRDSKPIVFQKESSEGEITTESKRKSSPSELNEIMEETSKPSDPEESVTQSPRAVKFSENTSQPKRSSNSVFRSKSFAAPGKDRAKQTGREDAPNPKQDRLSRSFSFGAKKKHQPPRPRPPTFFVSEQEPDDVANPETVSKEPSKDDVIMDEGISSSQEDLVESVEPVVARLKPDQDNSKHDSYITTDSDSENEKEEEKSKTYYISREILTTERTFVDAVKLVSEDFPNAVANGNKKFGRPIIPDETLQDILMNISQIYTFDSEFLKALENRMETWEKEERIGDIIKRFSPFLKMYKTYIQGYDNAMAILTDALKKYPQFAEVVKEFECSERCQNLRVGMYMLKPIQRIPSYRLLLTDYIKHLSKDSLDYKDVSDALTIVSEVATHINEDMKRADNFEEVLKIQRNLVGQVEIVKPGRELIKEGALMKLSRKEMQPRMFYLLTDVLLYTTPVANNQFRLNLSLPLEEIEVELPVSPDFENEFSIISRKKSFILSASTAEERDEWLEALRNASDEMRKKKITFHLAKKEKMDELYDAQQHDEDKDAKLGSKAPVWIPDVRVTMCMVCTDDFTVTNRRHHCRACGKVICGSCSSNSAPLAYLNDEPARVCDICHDELTAKAGTTQTATDTKENGVNADEKGAASPKLNSSAANKKGRKSRFFKSKEVPAVEESTISGYLKTRVGKKWQKRWYVVKDNVLYASKASSDPAAQETRPLLGYEVRGPEKMDGDNKKIVFQLIHAGTDPVVLQTDNIKHGEQWVNALRRATILPK